jgi:glutathione synthase/RimK-type ligase-like ATP-grasp enzyme
MGLEVRDIEDAFLHEMARLEMKAALGTLFHNLNHCLWVNGPNTIEQHRYKAHQLKLLQKAGLRIPQTLITNDAQMLRDFYERMNFQVIFKPVSGGAHTRLLTEEDFTPDRLAELAKIPVQFQECIHGVDIRVYAIKNTLYAAEIRAETIDFRDNPYAEVVPIELPDTVAQDCLTLMQTLDYHFSGIDMRRTADGEHVFIEGNPSPMFVVFEEITGYPVSHRLLELLIGNDSQA